MKKVFCLLLIFISCSQESQKSDESKTQKREELKTIWTGRINSIAEGHDVQRVNLWNSANNDRTIVCYLKNGDMVNVKKVVGSYLLVQSVSDNTCKGYCMAGFVKKIN